MPVTTSEFLDEEAELANLFGGVIVAHARVDLAYRCVETILQSLPPQHVVVVVNAPDEVADRSELIALSGQVTVVSPNRPQGYGANLNLGVQSLPAHVKFVVLSNDDIEFSDVWLAQIHGHFIATRSVGAVGFALRDSAGGLLLSTGEFPTPLDALVRSVAFPAWVKRLLQQVDGRLQKPRRQARRAAASHKAAQTADWVVGAAMVVRREAFLQVGGFDESFFLYFEETDLCDRLWARGWVVLSATDVPAIHLGGQSTAAERYRKTFREARRHYLVKRIGYVRWVLLELLFVPSFLFAGLSLIMSIMTRPASARSRLEAFRHSWQRRVFLML
jgi:N-acetylglucosaminyl-diphospho-decaprenol L-rhamnosyltransferase